MSVIIENEEQAKVLNQLAREQMIQRLLQDIVMDLYICDIEGWDKLEYLKRLQREINHFKTGDKNDKGAI